MKSDSTIDFYFLAKLNVKKEKSCYTILFFFCIYICIELQVLYIKSSWITKRAKVKIQVRVICYIYVTISESHDFVHGGEVMFQL